MNRAVLADKIGMLRIAGCTNDQILDAILPQVTTVAELKALHFDALLVTRNGVPTRAFNARGYLPEGPLTVVWQPEVTA